MGTDVDDLDEVIAYLKSEGYEIEGEIAVATVGRQAFVLDPKTRIIEEENVQDNT